MTVRGRTIVAALLGLVLLGGGCRSLTGRSVGRWVDDQTLAANVKQHLLPARMAPGNHIHVDTYEGVVYLSGVVDSDEARRRVESLARSVDNVEQVVTNLAVKSSVVAASPVASIVATDAHPLLGRLRGVTRISGDVGQPQGPWLAFDRAGRVVATIFTVSMRDLAQTGLDDLRSAGRAIDHVAIYPIVTHPDVPEPEYHVVLWHVTRAEAGQLR